VLTAELLLRPGATVQGFHASGDTTLYQDISSQKVLQNLNPRLPHVPAQRNLDVLTGSVSAGMKDTGHGMGRFFSQSDFTVHRVKRHAHFDEVGYAVGGFRHQDAQASLFDRPAPATTVSQK